MRKLTDVHMRCKFQAICEFQLLNRANVGLTYFSRYSGILAWGHMADNALGLDDRVSLITDIFSGSDEAEIVKLLRRNAVQSFVDAIDEVPPPQPSNICESTH